MNKMSFGPDKKCRIMVIIAPETQTQCDKHIIFHRFESKRKKNVCSKKNKQSVRV